MRVERADLAITGRCAEGQVLTIPIKCGEGAWYADEALVEALEWAGQIVFRYAGENPTGAVGAVAGVCNAGGNVVGLMPHPEHAVDPMLGSGDGGLLLAGLVDAATARAARRGLVGLAARRAVSAAPRARCGPRLPR